MPTDEPKLTTAIIGAGFIADYHINGLRNAGGADIACLVGRRLENTRARASERGIDGATSDYRTVLDDPGMEAVVIATPDATHREIAVAALEAGKAVMLQKPMAMSAEECREILAAAERSGARLSVSFMHRYFPEVRWLKDLLDRCQLGAIHAVRIRNATPGADWAEWFYSPGSVAGGVVMQLGVHGIDLCQHLLGPIADVSAELVTARPERRLSDGRTVTHQLEDNVVANYRLSCGALVSHEMSYTEAAGCDRFRLELYTEAGTVWLRTGRGPAAILAPAVTGQSDWATPAFEDEAPGAVHHRHWIEVAQGTAPPDDTGRAGLSVQRVAETIYRSAREGQRVRLPEEEPAT